MVHGVRLRDGQRRVVPQPLRRQHPAQRAPRRSPTSPDRTGTAATGGPNTNVGGFAGTTWAMVEAGGCPVELTYELETVGRNDFFGTLPGAFTAHPKVDPTTGEMHAMVYALPQWMDHVQYVVVAPDGKVRRTVDIPLPGIDDAARHVAHRALRGGVRLPLPARLRHGDERQHVPAPLAAGHRLPRRPAAARGRRPTDIVWVDLPDCYSFHPMNAYDDADGNVVIDLVVYDRMFDVAPHRPVRGQPRPAGAVDDQPGHRATPASTSIDATPQEFPRHRGSLTAKPYRYGYCARPSTSTSVEWPTLKHDLHTGAALVVRPRPGPRRRRAGVRRPPGRHRRGRRLADHVRPRRAQRRPPSSS